MRKFEDYTDGELVFYKNNYYDKYRAYKSQYTHNAFRLKNDKTEIIADISDITPVGGDREYTPTMDSDADASGIYHIQD
jgi:hypothetical protein